MFMICAVHVGFGSKTKVYLTKNSFTIRLYLFPVKKLYTFGICLSIVYKMHTHP